MLGQFSYLNSFSQYTHPLGVGCRNKIPQLILHLSLFLSSSTCSQQEKMRSQPKWLNFSKTYQRNLICCTMTYKASRSVLGNRKEERKAFTPAPHQVLEQIHDIINNAHLVHVEENLGEIHLLTEEAHH